MMRTQLLSPLMWARLSFRMSQAFSPEKHKVVIFRCKKCGGVKYTYPGHLGTAIDHHLENCEGC
jgi:hypothetical protein